jgi:hypothetical protein
MSDFGISCLTYYVIGVSQICGINSAIDAISNFRKSDMFPKLLKNENNNFGITIINFGIGTIRIPIYYVGGSIVGSILSIALPVRFIFLDILF